MNKYSFENFIMQCCKSPEWELRKFARKLLERSGFTVQEDKYLSRRGGKFDSVHNMLAIRGTPKVCLVAHTDVCRDHVVDGDDIPIVKPEIKIVEIDGEIKEIIQDEGPDYQVGGDDRLGVAINLNIALNTGMDLALLFTTDEEIGVVSAEQVKFPELLDFQLLVQVDRGNHSNQLVTRIGGTQLCSEEVEKRLLGIAENIGLPRYSVNGMLTDVLAIKSNKMCHNAVNMTCGYHNSFGSNKNEFIDIQEAKDTMKFVASIVKNYYLDDSLTKIISQKDRDDVPFSIEFSEEEIHAMEQMHNSFEPSKHSRKYYDNEDDVFNETLYKADKEETDSDWDSWPNYNQSFDD